MANVLNQEFQTFLKHLPDLLAQHPDKWVLIYHTDVIDIFDSEEEAVEVGYKMYRREPFLAKKIEEHEEPAVISSCVLDQD